MFSFLSRSSIFKLLISIYPNQIVNINFTRRLARQCFACWDEDMLEDGEEFIIGSSLVRNEILKSMKLGKTMGTASLLLSSSTFNLLFNQSSFKLKRSIAKYAQIAFSPPEEIDDNVVTFIQSHSRKSLNKIQEGDSNLLEGWQAQLHEANC